MFLIVLDSCGIDEEPGAVEYGDEDSDTLAACMISPYFHMLSLQKLGLLNIDGVDCWPKESLPAGAFEYLQEASKGKDTTTGHWEISGIHPSKPLSTYPGGSPEEVIRESEEKIGRRVLHNRPYSSTDVIRDYGKEHVEADALIIYTSTDSVSQTAAYESIVSPEELYYYCRIAREMLKEKHSVGRVIVCLLTGEYPNFTRTSNWHGFSMEPPAVTTLDQLSRKGFDVIVVSKINDVFVGRGVARAIDTKSDTDGIECTLGCLRKDFNGLCFINPVNFDILYGHHDDVDGYAEVLVYFDEKLPELLAGLRDDDLLMITADHGHDPSTPSTNHSREYTPRVIIGKQVKTGANLGTSPTFTNIGATILEYFGVEPRIIGKSNLDKILRQYGRNKGVKCTNVL